MLRMRKKGGAGEQTEIWKLRAFTGLIIEIRCPGLFSIRAFVLETSMHYAEFRVHDHVII